MLAERQAPERETDQPASPGLRSPLEAPAGEVLGLRQIIGNAAVARLLKSRTLPRCASPACAVASHSSNHDERSSAEEDLEAAQAHARRQRSMTLSTGSDALASAVAARAPAARVQRLDRAWGSERETAPEPPKLHDVVLREAVGPESQSGRRLLARELVHVAQQRATPGRKLMREAVATPGGASGTLASLTDTIGGYRARAEAALARSGLSASDLARVRRDIAFCAQSEARLRAIADSGNESASREVLSAFTQDGINSVLPRLTRVHPVQRIAVNEAPDRELATMPWDGPDRSRPSEREAERVAAALVPVGRAVSRRQSRQIARLLDTSTVRQTAEAIKPAVPALVAGAGAGAAAIATAPLWVWVVVAVVVVVALVALAYWVFSDDTETVLQPQPQPQASDRRDRGRQRQRERQPAPEQGLPPDVDSDELTERERCQAANPGAPVCSDARSMEDVARSYIQNGLGWNPASLGDCWGVGTFGPGQIDDCNGAPGERWHCAVDDPEHGSVEISLFGCLCCDENGNSRFQWEPHQSINMSRR